MFDRAQRVGVGFLRRLQANGPPDSHRSEGSLKAAIRTAIEDAERDAGAQAVEDGMGAQGSVQVADTPRHAPTRRDTPRHAATRCDTPRHAATRRDTPLTDRLPCRLARAQAVATEGGTGARGGMQVADTPRHAATRRDTPRHATTRPDTPLRDRLPCRLARASCSGGGSWLPVAVKTKITLESRQ